MATSRESILETTLRLFSVKGYRGTTMRDIAAAVGIKAGSLYAHISSKDELLLELIVRATDRAERAVIGAFDVEAPAAERLRRGIEAHLRIVADDLQSARVYFHEWRELDADMRKQIEGKSLSYQQRFERVIADGRDAGEFRDVDPALAAVAITSMLNVFHVWYSPSHGPTVEEVAQAFSDLVINGLRTG